MDIQQQLAELKRQGRTVTIALWEAIMVDGWPRASAIVDFGLDGGGIGGESQPHYEALYYPIRKGEISPKDLDAALGSGPKLTALVAAARSNPHKGIVFKTAYDDMLPEPE